jgi:arylsulfatase A-like enzyme
MEYLDYEDLDVGREMQNYYWNCTRDSDRHLKVLLDRLRESGQLERTVIVFTSDHGELLGAHGMRGKGTFAARESSRTPAVVVHPRGRKGVECEALSTHVDIAPTLLGLAGIERDEVRERMPMLVGQDLSSLVLDDNAIWSRDNGVLLHWTAILYQNHKGVKRFAEIRAMEQADRLPAIVQLMDDGLRLRGQVRGVYEGRWKFQRYSAPHRTSQPSTFDGLVSTHDIELYDTQTDPGETNNLAVDPTVWRSDIERLNAMLNKLIAAEVGTDDGSFVPTFGLDLL